jgi:hypothetical protein
LTLIKKPGRWEKPGFWATGECEVAIAPQELPGTDSGGGKGGGKELVGSETVGVVGVTGVAVFSGCFGFLMANQ